MVLFSPTIRFFWEGRWDGNHVEPRRRLYDCEFVYASEGEFQLTIGDKRHRMRKGSIAVIPPDAWHESRTSLRGYTVRHCIHFDWLPGDVPKQHPLAVFPGDPYDTSLVNPVPPYIASALPLVSHRESHGNLIKVVELALERLRPNDQLGVYLLWPILSVLLSKHSGARPSSAFPAKTARAVLSVRDYIDKHYAEPQGYETYRKLTRLSSSHLCRTFSDMIGQPPLGYLIDLRLHHACRLFQESSMNIAEVACAVGIPDANYFSRLFRRKFKRSPSRFLSSSTIS